MCLPLFSPLHAIFSFVCLCESLEANFPVNTVNTVLITPYSQEKNQLFDTEMVTQPPKKKKKAEKTALHLTAVCTYVNTRQFISTSTHCVSCNIHTQKQ